MAVVTYEFTTSQTLETGRSNGLSKFYSALASPVVQSGEILIVDNENQYIVVNELEVNDEGQVEVISGELITV
jgi:hypothetical protein